MTLAFHSFNFASTLMLAGAAIGAAIGANATARALQPSAKRSPWPHAIAFSAMTLAIGLSAIQREPAMPAAAVGVCFSASVAAMTLALGIVVLVASRGRMVAPVPVAVERSGLLLLPIALMTQLIGFTGTLRPGHARMLTIEAIAIAPLLIRFGKPRAIRISAIVVSLLSLALIAVCGWAAMTAATDLATRNALFRPSILNALILGPVIVLPMIPSLATISEAGETTTAIETLVLFVFLNLCVVLPILAAVRPEMAIPLLTWRIDSLLLVIVGLLLLPAALGRWSIGRREGMALVAGFVMYLMITLVAALG